MSVHPEYFIYLEESKELGDNMIPHQAQRGERIMECQNLGEAINFTDWFLWW